MRSKTPYGRVLVLFAALLGACAGPVKDAPPPRMEPRPATSACRIPFDGYAAFADFVRDRSMAHGEEPMTRAMVEAALPGTAFAYLRGPGVCVRWNGQDGRPRGHVVTPRDPARAVVVFLRGGMTQDDAVRFGDLVEMATFAQRGFTVIAPEYRPSAGRDELGGSDTDAIGHVIDEAKALSEPHAPVLLVAASRGAINAYQLVQRRSDIAAVATIGGVLDARALLAQRPELQDEMRAALPDFDAHRDAYLRARSAVTWADTITIPTLTIQGEQDVRVDPATASAFVTKRGEVLRLPAGHGVWSHRAEARQAIFAFFERALLPAVYLNHAYVVLDADTYESLRQAAMADWPFAAVDGGLPWFKPVDATTDVLYVRGASTYLELMAPVNHFEEPLHKVGIGLGVEEQGGAARVFMSLAAAGAAPYFSHDFVTFAGPAPVPWKYTAIPATPLAEGVDVWVSEYDQSFVPWLSRGHARGIRRSDMLAGHQRPRQQLADITGLKLAIPEPELPNTRAWLAALGFVAEGDVWHAADFALELTPTRGPARMQHIVMRLGAVTSCDVRFGHARLVCDGQRATLSLFVSE